MDVLLKKPLPPHGKSGDVISVSESYARNFLLPRGVAVVATASVIRETAAQKKRQQAEAASIKQEHQTLLTTLNALTIHLSARANANGKLYAALQEADVLRGLQQEHHVRGTGLHFTGVPIKTTGPSSVGIRFPDGQTATLTVEVQPLP